MELGLAKFVSSNSFLVPHLERLRDSQFPRSTLLSHINYKSNYPPYVVPAGFWEVRGHFPPPCWIYIP